MFAGALALGLEGIVAKDSKSTYIQGLQESSYWLKTKDKSYKLQEKMSFTLESAVDKEARASGGKRE
jgi:hypothetical protein